MADDNKVKTYEYYAAMSCGGCKNAVSKILSKCDGVTQFDADVASKKITVTGTFDPQDVLAKLAKWGTAANKEVRYVGETGAAS